MGITSTERARKYFYGEEEADTYDACMNLTQPYYALMHDTLNKLLEYHCGVAVDDSARLQKLAVLDLGSGTGAEALRNLTAFPHSHVVAVDLCPPMNACLRKNFQARFPKVLFETRCSLIEGDAFGPECGVEQLLAALPRGYGIKGFDAVISGFMLHHYTAEEKRNLYRRIIQLLRPAGIFANVDLFTFESPTVARYADHFGVNCIERQLTHPERGCEESFAVVEQKVDELRIKYIRHWKEENIPLPFERLSRGSESPNVKSESMILQDVGFRETACPYRFWTAGIATALKP